MIATCPVCQSELDFEPWHGVGPSDEICPSCGIQFGYNDARADLRPRIYALWREEWIANGRRAFQGEAWSEVSVRIGQRAQGRLVAMSTVLKKVEAWPFVFGGEPHSGWLPANAVTPPPTPVERELLDVQIESTEGGYLLTWAARPSPTCQESGPPKVGDTWHETIEDAEVAARDSFGIEHEHWTDTRPTA